MKYLIALLSCILVTSSYAAVFEPNQHLSVYVTLYGSPDNDPPNSGAIAFPNKLHKVAGGVGTYDDPVSFAVKLGWMKPFTRIYYPTLRKYFYMEDECASCKKRHVDLWAGYGTRKGGILKCERALTEENSIIIVNPSNDYPVDVTPIWNEVTKQCQMPY